MQLGHVKGREIPPALHFLSHVLGTRLTALGRRDDATMQ